MFQKKENSVLQVTSIMTQTIIDENSMYASGTEARSGTEIEKE